MSKFGWSFLWFLLAVPTQASVTLPYTYSGNVPPSQANANDQALRDEINAHEALPNAHNTSLPNVLAVNATVGANPINFNLTQLLSALAENLGVDPTCNAGSKGRLYVNTASNLLKFCDGTNNITIAGTGVNNLSSVLGAGNSAGSNDLNMNERQILSGRVENVSADPTTGNIGRVIWNTTSSALKIDNGASWTALGGSQNLSGILSVGNSAGASNLDMNGNQVLNLKVEALASDPGTTYAARVYYNTTSNKLRYYNGSSWSDVGNTNTLAATMALGNSVGSNDLNMNGRQVMGMRLENTASPPGTGSAGRIWYDTLTDQVDFETAGASNRVMCTLDNAQTLTNKTISGSSNTFTNIPDGALSANVGLLNGNQTITGTKTFSASPIVSSLKTPSGAIHILTDGLANDTITLNNAVQTLAGKTLNAPTLSGNLDFAEYQAQHMRLENLASTPSAGNAGRMIYKTSTGEVQYDTGSNWLTFQSNNPTPLGWQIGGNSGLSALTNYLGTADAVDVVMKANNSEILRLVSGGGIKTQLGTGLVKSTTGTLGLAVASTDYAPPTATTSALKGNGAGGFSAAASTDLTDTANIDLLNGIQTISAAKTFSSAPTFSSLTAKSVPFLGTGGLVSEDNTGFQYDGTNHRLGLGVTPAVTLDIKGNATDTQPTIQLTASNGNGPTKITTVTSGAMLMQNNAKNILQSDTTGHVSLVAGAANGPANLDSVIAQNQASETTHNTYAAQGIASQTGDLFTGYASGSSTKLFSITIAGKGSFSNLQDAAIGTAGLGRWDASGNLVSASELSGDVTTSGSNAVTIANSAVTNAKIANSTIDLTAKVTGTLPFGNGGTGQSSYTDGQLLIGNSSTGGLTRATLSAGANITITNGNGSISIAASGGGGGGGGAQVAFSGFTGFSSGCANQVWRYSTTVISSGGTDISVNDSTTLGTQFTALTSGLYDISFNYGGQTGGSTTAIMVNDPSCTTVPTSQSASTTAGVLATCSASGTGIVGTCHAFAKLSANDVITIKTNVTGTSISNDMRTIFHMIKASN